MATDANELSRKRIGRWRLAAWTALIGGLLMIPAVAMQYTREVDWTGSDFVVAGILLLGLAVPIELALRSRYGIAYKTGAILTVTASFLMVWSNLAVGIIGDEDNPLNLSFLVVIALGLTGSIAARFRPVGMAWAVGAMAVAQAAIAALTQVLGWGRSEPPGMLGLMLLIGFFAAIWAVAAALFQLESRR